MEQLLAPFEDENLSLRPAVEADFPALFKAASDPHIWAQHNAHDRWKEEVFRSFFNDGMANELGMLIIENKETQKVLGSSRYYKFDAAGNCLRVGYTFFDRSVWGTGINAQVKKLMLDRAFQVVNTVYFDVYEKNFRSQRALQKLGAVLVEKKEDKWVFGLDRSKWKK